MNKSNKTLRVIIYSLFILIFLFLALYFGFKLFGIS